MRFVLPRLDRWRRPLARFGRPAPSQLPAGPLRTTARFGSVTTHSPLAIALLAAIALHLLALSALQLRQRRQPAAAVPAARDDTPELLQFSRHQTREPAITPLTIASLAQLPPPPPALEASGLSMAGTTPNSRRAPLSSRDARRSRAGESRTSRPQISVNRAQTPPRPGSGPARSEPGLESALAALGRMQAEPDARTGTGAAAGWPAPQKPDAEQLGLWKRLWEKAIPAGSTAGGSRPLPSGVELRRLASVEGEAGALPEGRRLSLLLGERLLLAWLAGRDLWLLQAPASRPESDADAVGSGS